MSLYEALVALLGTPPSGAEPVVYRLACIICLFTFNAIISFVFSIFGGRK